MDATFPSSTQARRSKPTRNKMRPVALGFRAHSGWAAMVAVAGTPREPEVILRRRIELSDRDVPGSTMLYHAAEGMALGEAEQHIRRCRQASDEMARQAFESVIGELSDMALSIRGACLLLASGRVLPDLSAILASHPLIHTAEGEFFRQRLRTACVERRIELCGIAEKELPARAVSTLSMPEDQINGLLAAIGRLIGPPWQVDQKLATLAAIVVLAE